MTRPGMAEAVRHSLTHAAICGRARSRPAAYSSATRYQRLTLARAPCVLSLGNAPSGDRRVPSSRESPVLAQDHSDTSPGSTSEITILQYYISLAVVIHISETIIRKNILDKIFLIFMILKIIREKERERKRKREREIFKLF